MKKARTSSRWPLAATLALLSTGLLAAGPVPTATEEKAKMIATYDLRVKNPYGEKLSTRPLDTGAAFKVISLAIPAGQELPEHTTPTPAVLFMLEGEARFVTAAEEIPLAPGTVVHIPPDIAHRVVAVRDSHLVLVK